MVKLDHNFFSIFWVREKRHSCHGFSKSKALGINTECLQLQFSMCLVRIMFMQMSSVDCHYLYNHKREPITSKVSVLAGRLRDFSSESDFGLTKMLCFQKYETLTLYVLVSVDTVLLHYVCLESLNIFFKPEPKKPAKNFRIRNITAVKET